MYHYFERITPRFLADRVHLGVERTSNVSLAADEMLCSKRDGGKGKKASLLLYQLGFFALHSVAS